MSRPGGREWAALQDACRASARLAWFDVAYPGVSKTMVDAGLGEFVHVIVRAAWVTFMVSQLDEDGCRG